MSCSPCCLPLCLNRRAAKRPGGAHAPAHLSKSRPESPVQFVEPDIDGDKPIATRLPDRDPDKCAVHINHVGLQHHESSAAQDLPSLA
jgi:hypothetical protein